MTKKDLESRKNKERNRIRRLLKDSGADEWKIKMLAPTIENTAWMSAKLEDTIERIKDEDVAVPYNNGGGQEGIRQNPKYQGYESLWKSYISGMSQIMSVAGVQKDAKADKLQPKSVLALVRSNQQRA